MNLYVQNGTRKTTYPSHFRVIEVDFTANPAGVDECGRCRRDLNVHVSQLIDYGMAEQDGVVECDVMAGVTS
ncbi:hypothetical protein [Actinoplanes sp. NPDC051494]|uniref:hypothetical protein n=1 Tax=Actinoplanes sp. NPDC051494 TaxID=3363907 RepID=UPI0037B18CE2